MTNQSGGKDQIVLSCHPELNGTVATSVTYKHEEPPAFMGLHTIMKQPRLPGTEKFRFSTTGEKHRPLSESQASETTVTPQYVFHSRTSSISSQSDLRPIASTMSVPALNRHDSKRRAVLPITCKKTSRMLTNTNLELNVDPADIIPDEAVKRHVRITSTRVPSCPNLESSHRSLNSSKSSLDTHFRKMSLQNPIIRELPKDFDWKNIRASPSRLSASCSSCCSSEENVWVLREDPEM
ncbi:hypothetical protein JTE90_000052 [Oedothorax gibbosus]|uniref:Uncharacterized protein n=1 Tax=Oedothorax gibbosus TaxID=931172 RepID=A0AAV6UD15_9ARAC|nr:hypothetical protein JTE90_000052 [Oedothorax gibbosus]